MISFINSLITKLAAFCAAFFLGRETEKNEQTKKENKRLKSNIGISDSSLANKLRERAANKRDRD